MSRKIKTPTMGKILFEEYMKPMGISSYSLAKGINVPVSRVQDIIHDRRKITVDTSLRLAKFFGVSDTFFLNIQNDIDARNLKISLEKDINNIKTYKLSRQSNRLLSVKLSGNLPHK